MLFTKYKDIFGKPNEGLHAHRIFGFAAVDIILTIIAAIIISTYWNYTFISALIGLFIVAQVLHYLVGVETAFIKMMKNK